jgi:hypothetical protein
MESKELSWTRVLKLLLAFVLIPIFVVMICGGLLDLSR